VVSLVAVAVVNAVFAIYAAVPFATDLQEFFFPEVFRIYDPYLEYRSLRLVAFEAAAHGLCAFALCYSAVCLAREALRGEPVGLRGSIVGVLGGASGAALLASMTWWQAPLIWLVGYAVGAVAILSLNGLVAILIWQRLRLISLEAGSSETASDSAHAQPPSAGVAP
jgi:hypothetical protein